MNLAIAAAFFGEFGMVFGLLSRVAALGIGVNTAAAVPLLHRHFNFFMNWTGTQKGEGFEFHLLVMAMAFAGLVKGNGALSMDHLIHQCLSLARAEAGQLSGHSLWHA